MGTRIVDPGAGADTGAVEADNTDDDDDAVEDWC